jgi:hypothetical protein
VKFGWYTDGNYRYFGMYTDYAYSSVPFITKLDGSSGGGVFNAEYGEFYMSATMPTGWEEVTVEKFAIGADLANYLPLSGGTVANADIEPLIINRLAGANSFLGFQGNGAQFGDIGFVGVDHLVRRSADGTAMKRILDEGNVGSYALPITGGTVGNGTSYTPVKVNGVADGSYIEFEGNGNRYGRLGFYGESQVGMLDNNSNLYPLLHTGNSAKVVVSDTAPTDTNTVWFDTSEV